MGVLSGVHADFNTVDSTKKATPDNLMPQSSKSASSCTHTLCGPSSAHPLQPSFSYTQPRAAVDLSQEAEGWDYCSLLTDEESEA